jgi:hypothetical protein
MTQKIRFEKHHGTMDFSDGTVVFYKLIFKNIIDAGNFLRELDPGNYKGWVQGDHFGIVDLDTGWIYSNFDWHPPNSIDIYVYDDTKESDTL